jgi:hypothetical protein
VLSGTFRASSIFWKNCTISGEPVFIGRMASRIRFPSSSLYWLRYSVFGLDALVLDENVDQLFE